MRVEKFRSQLPHGTMSGCQCYIQNWTHTVLWVGSACGGCFWNTYNNIPSLCPYCSLLWNPTFRMQQTMAALVNNVPLSLRRHRSMHWTGWFILPIHSLVFGRFDLQPGLWHKETTKSIIWRTSFFHMLPPPLPHTHTHTHKHQQQFLLWMFS